MISEFLSYSIVPLLSALAIPFLGRKNEKITEILANVTILAGLINIGYILFNPSNHRNQYSTFTQDGFTLLMIFTIYLVAMCVVFFSTRMNDRKIDKNSYYPLIMLSVSAMCSMVMARDFFTLYIFMEALAVTSFALITTDDGRGGIEGALKYFLLTFPASALIIIGLALLMIVSGGFSFEHIQAQIIGAPDFLTFLALSLILLGFLIKSGMVPFHFWTPDAYQGSYSPVSAYLAGIVTKISGVYAIIRLSMFFKLFDDKAYKASEMLLLIGFASIAWGAIAAMRQKDFKRMLAFSSISQLGYILMGAGTFTTLGIIAAIFHLFNHATFKTTLFLNSASLEKNAGTTDMKKLGGMEHNMPVTSWTSIIALFSTAGLPPLSGFWSKIMIIIALWMTGSEFYAAAALIFSIVTLAYFMIMQKKIFFGKANPEFAHVKEVDFTLLSPVLLMSAIIIAAGVFFPYVYDYLANTIATRMVI